jgi:hypothetical protein
LLLERQFSLIVRCDPNFHNVLCRRPDVSHRSGALIEYLGITDLEMVYQEEEPTIPTERQQEILGVTPCSGKLVSEDQGWGVLPEL